VPLDTIPLPYGLRDVQITPYTTAAATALGTEMIDFPNARRMSFSEAEEYEELRGDDKIVTTRGKGASVDWDLEGGGFSFEAVRAMFGGTITETGTTPAQVKSFRKNVSNSRPFFRGEGQSMSDSGGDVHANLFLCRCTGNLSGEMADGSFWLTGASGVALPSRVTADLGDLYEFVQNEEATAIELAG
jgi:hypothetical protein